MKTNKFSWAWGDHEATLDKSMTRGRAARLIRAWRRCTTQGRRDFELKLVRTSDANWYCVKTRKYINDESGILVIHKKGV